MQDVFRAFVVVARYPLATIDFQKMCHTSDTRSEREPNGTSSWEVFRILYMKYTAPVENCIIWPDV